MVALSFLDTERVYFHLGMGNRAGIPAGDLAKVEEACKTITSQYMHDRVLEQLAVCDEAWEAQKLANQGYRYGTREQYSGDINRAIIRESSKDVRIWKENYRDEVAELARVLWVPNYRADGVDRWRFSRDGAAFVKAIPGVADTSVSSRRLEFVQLAGSFGY